jgi:hypothetical protein
MKYYDRIYNIYQKQKLDHVFNKYIFVQISKSSPKIEIKCAIPSLQEITLIIKLEKKLY